MCGIAGIYNFNPPGKPVSEDIIKHMLTSIRHRGPDESGMLLTKNLGIGSVRLSIIDLATGQQPVSIRNKRYWIVYNGELFNYIELRKELEKRGCHFETSSDTEVVVQAYAEYGEDCLNKFNGQFAICIWDKEKNELFLARDRVGIRPLFYANQNDSFTFCSEIKGIFQNPFVERKISPKRLSQVFTFWTTITPDTPFEGIKELPPGHFMKVNSNGVTLKKYWSLKFPDTGKIKSTSIDQSIEELRELFYDAVKIRLRADVEVAAYLSGGIDSSVTTAFIHDIEPSVLNTFSIGFKDRDFDETNYQLEAAKYFGTNHTAFTCTSEEIGEAFYDTVKHTEFPILRTAPTPMFLLSKKVRENNIKVVITGEGADEMLAGYNIFKEAKIRRFWAKQPQSKLRPLLLTKLYPYLPMMKNAKANVLKMFFGYKLEDTGNPFYSHLLRWHNTSRIQNYFSESIKERIEGYSPLDDALENLEVGFDEYGDLAKSQSLESNIFMSGYLLSSQGDRMAMGNSVEGRYPFLDYRIIEYAARLPEDFKLNGLNEKYILKKMMAGKIPDSILNRHKQAYRAPIHTSFLGEQPPEWVGEMLSESSLNDYGLFDFEKVGKLITKFKSGQTISEVDNMALAGILSSQLVNLFFIQGKALDIKGQELSNLRIIRN
ncbi:MAG: asparagine synthase (glutamine-hydrolyzing) [Bacteroidales bacterium]